MEYISLYRKYRPQIFEEIIGQEHIVRTFQNAIRLNRLSHAYLFCGPRGTGKTTLARVLAKSLNCNDGPTDTPCLKCEMCKRIANGSALDVIEIDAASNRGIDEIRDLREKVKFYPTEGKYKIYIIDEVHMLTTEAFNALLKTLEEPPPHTFFIMATTEPHKVPSTILSRCQRFDFKRISSAEIAKQIMDVAKKEKIEIDSRSADLLSRASEGSMRDALSLLDRVALYSDNKVDYDNVVKLLGMLDIVSLLNLVEAIAEKETSRIFDIVSSLIDDGKEPRQICKGLIDFFRNLLVVKVCERYDDLILATEEYRNSIKEISKLFAQSELQEIIDILCNADANMKWETHPRIFLEMCLIKIVSLREKSSSSTIKKEKDIKLDEVLSIEKIKGMWNDILKNIRKSDISLFSIVYEATPSKLEENTLVLAFPKKASFSKSQLQKSEYKLAFEKKISDILGKDIKISCEIAEPKKESTDLFYQKRTVETIEEVFSCFEGSVIIEK